MDLQVDMLREYIFPGIDVAAYFVLVDDNEIPIHIEKIWIKFF